MDRKKINGDNYRNNIINKIIMENVLFNKDADNTWTLFDLPKNKILIFKNDDNYLIKKFNGYINYILKNYGINIEYTHKGIKIGQKIQNMSVFFIEYLYNLNDYI